MLKLAILILFSLPLLSFGLSDEESELRDQILKEYSKKAPVEKKVETLENQEKLEEEELRANIVSPNKKTPKKNKEIEKLNSQIGNSFFGGMVSAEMKAQIAEMITDNPFQHMSDEQVKGLLVSRVGKSFEDNPKLLSGVSEWIRDENALPDFMAIIGESEKLKTYGICFIVVFVSAFLINLKNGNKSLFKRLIYKLVLMMSTTVINVGIFFFLFQENLTPTVNILKKYLIP